ncbi:hypothetical protein [Corallococcus exercitus]|uniref:hypothetical protein n=1 Tax=Corallococcus exercitus TaxID=2316736 RepID=UPI0035D5004D
MARLLFVSSLLLGLACAQPAATPGVVQINARDIPERIPGPMPGFGPFDTYSDALISACSMMLKQPHATAGRKSDMNFRLRWDLSQEYCAWIYYTPDERFEMSMMSVTTIQDARGKRSCRLPPKVDDARYPPESLGYVYLLHTHPYEGELTEQDIRYIVAMGQEHGWEVKTKAGMLRLSLVAFFSASNEPANPTCDGFFQYTPTTGDLSKWTQERNQWRRQSIGSVNWIDAEHYRIDRH